MKQQSLRDFKKEKFPTMQNYKFSAMLGFDNSLISKILNGKYDCPNNSPKWVELKQYMAKNYDIVLVKTSSHEQFFEALDNKEYTIKRLTKENEQLKKEKAELEEYITRLLSSIRVIEEGKCGVSYNRFKYEKYKNHKELNSGKTR